jgi:hypothetical protein
MTFLELEAAEKSEKKTTTKQQLRERMREMSVRWMESKKCAKLREIKLNMQNASAYIDMDTAEAARVRARFRFDTIYSNHHHMKHPHRDTPRSSHCDHTDCKDKEETRSHILLDCPRYAAQRMALSINLNRTLTLPLLFGENTDEDNRKIREGIGKERKASKKHTTDQHLMDSTAAFLLHVCVTRGL